MLFSRLVQTKKCEKNVVENAKLVWKMEKQTRKNEFVRNIDNYEWVGQPILENRKQNLIKKDMSDVVGN